MAKVLKFFTPVCPYCKIVFPKLDEAVDETGIEVVSVDCMEDDTTREQHDVISVPTLIFFNDDGEQVARTTGLVSKTEILENIAKAQA